MRKSVETPGWGRGRRLPAPHHDVAGEFATACAEMGLTIPGMPIMDGHLHRVPVAGDRHGQKSGAYVGHLDGLPAGYIKNYKTGEERRWRAEATAATLSAAERVSLQAEVAQHRIARDLERQRLHEQTIHALSRHLEDLPAISPEHPYLARKMITSDHGALAATGAPLSLAGTDKVQRWGGRGTLIIPIRDLDGNLIGAQSINAEGWKAFPRGARWQGGMHLIGAIVASSTVVIVEGFATGASLREATGLTVAVAFHAGNLLTVAKAIRTRHAEARLIIAGDDDHLKPLELGPNGRPKINVGRVAAEMAAAETGGIALLPQFERGDKGTDWNDLIVDKGLSEFTAQWQAGLARAERHLLAATLAKARAGACALVPEQRATPRR